MQQRNPMITKVNNQKYKVCPVGQYLFIEKKELLEVWGNKIGSIILNKPILASRFVWNIGLILDRGNCRDESIQNGDLVYFGEIFGQHIQLPNEDGIAKEITVVKDVSIFGKLDSNKKFHTTSGKILGKITQQGKKYQKSNLLLQTETDPNIKFRKVEILEISKPLDESVKEARMNVKVGDIVYVRRASGTTININNEEFIILQPIEILGVVTNKEKK